MLELLCLPPPQTNPCPQPDYPRGIADPATRHIYPVVNSADGPTLFVSNAPELLNVANLASAINLFKIEKTGARSWRVYIWHINGSNVATQVALRITGPTTISGFRICDRSGLGYMAARGICTAKAHLYNSYIPDNSKNGPVNGEQELWSTVMPPATPEGSEQSSMACAVMEFTTTGPETVKLRTVATKDIGSYGFFSDPLVEPDNMGLSTATHTRGCWEHSRLICTIPGQLDVKLQQAPGSPIFLEGNVVDSMDTDPKTPGPESSYFLATSGGPGATNNLGCYGVNLHYRLFAINTDTVGRKLYVYLHARGIGFAWWGAAKITEPERNAPDAGCLPIPAPAGFWFVYLRLQDLCALFPNPPYPLTVPANTSSGAPFRVTVSLAIGGAATTPVNLTLSRDALMIEPVEEPG